MKLRSLKKCLAQSRERKKKKKRKKENKRIAQSKKLSLQGMSR